MIFYLLEDVKVIGMALVIMDKHLEIRSVVMKLSTSNLDERMKKAELMKAKERHKFISYCYSVDE